MKLSRIAVVFCSIVGMAGSSAQSALAAAHMKENMVAYTISEGPTIKSIKKSLTGKPGDMVAGEKTMTNKKKGNCLACHVISKLKAKAKADPKRYSDMGLIGPALDGVASRYTQGELRMLLVNSKEAFPDTIMPGFYRTKNLFRVKGKFKGKTVLKAQEIEDILAFLLTLK